MQKGVLVYLFAIVAPSLILLYLGLQSVQRQHQAIRVLAESNRTLAAEKLAAGLEQRTRQLAEVCLRDRNCPLALHFFNLEGGRLTRPRVQSPPARDPAGIPALFREAEAREFHPDQLPQALEGYRSVYDSNVPPPVKALALSRVARCLEKLNRKPEALEAWQQLRDGYGSLYDPLHRPYELVGRFELNQPDGVYEALLGDRWDLSAEQFDYYIGRLNRAAPAGNRFAFARELEEHFHAASPLREGELYSYALPHSQVLYRAAGPGEIAGLSVNASWVAGTLAPALRQELHLPETAPVESNRDLWIYGGSTAAVLAVLLLGVVFVVRDARREVRMSRLRADFVSGVSHELKTPLTLIRLYGETLLGDSDSPAEERRGYYEIITRESERLSHLIQKVLSFSRIDRGEKAYTLQEGDLAGVVGEIVEAYRQYLERAGFAVETRLADTLPAVRFDADAVSQAVVNLLDNAVKYSGASKFIGIRLRQDAGSAVFEVEDRGIGIPAAERQKIFQRFYRVPNGAGKGGYGLGLFLVRHIMEAHLGRVEVESEPGAGSCFRLVFPAFPEPHES